MPPAVESGPLSRALELHPQVALRPEPFGALAYHYGNRKLVFLKHPDVVAVVRALAAHASLAATLEACSIAADRWPTFVAALENLEASDIVRERTTSTPVRERTTSTPVRERTTSTPVRERTTSTPVRERTTSEL